MESTAMPTADAITHDEFTALLEEYPRFIDTIAESQKSKPSQKTLQQLDEYRYSQAIADFSPTPPKEMTIEDVRLLVEWKLRHGKFRPMLLGLAGSNNGALTRRTISAAIRAYRSSSDITAALKALQKLRGIGPATASLLLTVHDPERVIFFSDEVFKWLCADYLSNAGKKAKTIKYNDREYEMLRRNAENIVKRLRVSATDVEKVAYVLIKRAEAKREEEAKETKEAEEAEKGGDGEEEEGKNDAIKPSKSTKAGKLSREAKTARARQAKREKKAKKSTKKAKSTEEEELPREISSGKGKPLKRKRAATNGDEAPASTKRSKRVKE